MRILLKIGLTLSLTMLLSCSPGSDLTIIHSSDLQGYLLECG